MNKSGIKCYTGYNGDGCDARGLAAMPYNAYLREEVYIPASDFESTGSHGRYSEQVAFGRQDIVIEYRAAYGYRAHIGLCASYKIPIHFFKKHSGNFCPHQ